MSGGGSPGTPILDFVRAYAVSDAVRLHMPGHKGRPLPASLDITEIEGADSLYEADGIIAQSERNAARLFGSAATLYSAEGSSLCIRAMLLLARLWAERIGRRPLVLAARNAHRVFSSTAALLGLDVEWLPPARGASRLSCPLPPRDELRGLLRRLRPAALWITSPDYLGSIADIGAAAEACRGDDALLLTDNAHGAYLRFLPESLHPLDRGTDICCDSAHKTLPALTGAAYLHLSRACPPFLRERARRAMGVFGSTSPSYLILQSLDALNPFLSDGFREALAALARSAGALRRDLEGRGLRFLGDEPLKWTLDARPVGYSGTDLATFLAGRGVVSEYADPDVVVLMLPCRDGERDLERLYGALRGLPLRDPLPPPNLPEPFLPERVLPLPETRFLCGEQTPIEEAEGRVLASAPDSCPPAVPIAVAGERVDRRLIACLRYYGITRCEVL